MLNNASNSLRRDRMLSAVKVAAPDLFRFVSSAYERPSSLFFGDYIIDSAEGVQQGDPLGPLLFCLSIHPFVSQLKSSISVFYLDDGLLGGLWEDVLADLRFVEEEASKLGLRLNHGKSELICDDGPTCEAMLRLQPISCSQATFLGTPIGSVECIDVTIKKKIELLKLMGDQLCHLQSHDALILLRHSFEFYIWFIRHRVFIPHSWSSLTNPFVTFSSALLMSMWMMLLGYKLPFQLGQVVLESVVQFSWHPLPIWPLLLAVQIWSTRSFLLPC